MNMPQRVLYEIEDGVGTITLNRPDVANAINVPLAQGLAVAVDAVVRADVGAVLLCAAGRHFCAGGDIREFAARRNELDTLVSEILDALCPAVHQLATLPVPVVSVVHGPIGGAGIALALCADVVMAAPEMRLRGGYTAIGFSPDAGVTYLLTRRAGHAIAKYVLLTNRILSAQDCLRLGLIDELHATEILPYAARELATALAHGPTGALSATKRLCEEAMSRDLRAHMQCERHVLLRAVQSDNAGEGIAAFVEKRAARFKHDRAI